MQAPMLFSKLIYQRNDVDGVGTQKYPTHNLKMCFEPLLKNSEVAGRAQRGLWSSAFYFCHILRIVTRNCARFEALESLFNFLSNHEKISIKLMIFILWFWALFVDELLKSRVWSRVFDTLLLNAPIMNDYLQKIWKTIKWYINTLNHDYTLKVRLFNDY